MACVMSSPKDASTCAVQVHSSRNAYRYGVLEKGGAVRGQKRRTTQLPPGIIQVCVGVLFAKNAICMTANESSRHCHHTCSKHLGFCALGLGQQTKLQRCWQAFRIGANSDDMTKLCVLSLLCVQQKQTAQRPQSSCIVQCTTHHLLSSVDAHAMSARKSLLCASSSRKHGTLTCNDHTTDCASDCDMSAVATGNVVVSVAHSVLAIQTKLL